MGFGGFHVDVLMTLMGKGGKGQCLTYNPRLWDSERDRRNDVSFFPSGMPGTLRRKVRIAHERCRDVLTRSPPSPFRPKLP